jgi:hypothetical protein
MRVHSIAALGLSLSAALTFSLSSASSALAAPSAASHSSSVAAPRAAASIAAAAAADPCSGKSQTKVVTTFIRGPEVFPLRCGTTTWGYNHIVYRDHNYDPALIALTISRGSQPVPGEQVLQYKWESETCPVNYKYTYTVVYNQGALNGNGVRPQGVITAYESVQAEPDSAHEPDC